MGYAKIPNLYKDQNILLFKECYAMEKVHGTSAHLRYINKTPKNKNNAEIRFFSGGSKHQEFIELFYEQGLIDIFHELGHTDVTIFGEACGGAQQKMSHTYGPKLLFIAFEAQVNKTWLTVPDAEELALKLGLEFVPYERIPANLAAVTVERDKPSRVAKRRGIVEDKVSEGVVLRPIQEVEMGSGKRLMAKHKTAKFSERASKGDTILDPKARKDLTGAQAIAEEWVTDMRLEHVLDKFPQDVGYSGMQKIIPAMINDVMVEGEGEFEPTRAVRKAIGARAAKLFSIHLRTKSWGDK